MVVKNALLSNNIAYRQGFGLARQPFLSVKRTPPVLLSGVGFAGLSHSKTVPIKRF